jgi:nitrogen fixation protein FixH
MAEITGRQVLVFTVGAFAIIIGVNLVMAWKAISTFPGLEAQNTFVASQEFDIRRDAQEALGWQVATAHEGGQDGGRVKLAITDAAGLPVQVASLEVLIGRPTSARDDVRPEFSFQDGMYQADVALQPGQWMLKLLATSAEGTRFEQRFDLMVGR